MTSIPCVPGLLLHGVWIPPLRSPATGAEQLIDIIFAARGALFPTQHVSRFGLDLADDVEETIRVDLALVSKTLEAWNLVFVEPTRHFNVEALIEKTQAARLHNFTIREARELQRQMPDIDLDALRKLVHHPPGFIVITDDPHLGWRIRAAGLAHDVHIMIVEPFPLGDHYAIRLNGDRPNPLQPSVIARCSQAFTHSRCLIVDWVEPDSKPDIGFVTLVYGSMETKWELVHADSNSQLYATGAFPLQEDPPFELVKDSDGTMIIRKAS